MTRASWIIATLALGLTLTGLPGCGVEHCRYDPDCGGGIGAFCDFDDDCAAGFCCQSDNCGGGMCTYDCRDDADCPSDMLCEHNTCFFDCIDDRDCAVGMSCEHDNTICEWE